MDVAVAALEDIAAWQRLIDGYLPLFEPLAANASVGLVPRFFTDPTGARRNAAMPSTPALPMLEWRRTADRMTALPAIYRGLESLAVDLLFLAGDGALEAVLARAEHPLGEMKAPAPRRAHSVLRVTDQARAPRPRLWDFVEALGLPFLGACR